MCRDIETIIAAIIDAMTLSEVTNLDNESRILQPTCNNLCARLAQECVESIGCGIGMAGKWGQTLFCKTSAGAISSAGKLGTYLRI